MMSAILAGVLVVAGVLALGAIIFAGLLIHEYRKNSSEIIEQWREGK